MYITTLQIQEYGINGQLTRERGRGENRRKVSEKKEERNRNHQKRGNKLTVTETKIELMFLDDFLHKHLEPCSPALDLHIKLC